MRDYRNHQSQPIYITLHQYLNLPPIAPVFTPALNPDPGPTFVAGETISGTIRVDPSSRPQRITATLQGRIKVKITRSNGQYGSTIYSSKTVLFSHTLEVFSSPAQTQSFEVVRRGISSDGRVDLPFSFAIPVSVERPPETKLLDRPDFECMPGHEIPPSFADGDQRVEYSIHASLYTESRHTPSTEIRQPIHLTAPHAVLPVSQTTDLVPIRAHPIYCHSHRLHPSYTTSKPLLKKLQTRLSLSNTYAHFSINLRMPQATHIDAVLPITLTLTHGPRSPSLPNPPEIHLRKISITISQRARVRIPSSSLLGSSEVEETYRHHIPLGIRDFEATTTTGGGHAAPQILLYDGLKLEEMLDLQLLARRHRGLVTGFKSYVLAVEHKVKVDLWIECVGEKFSFTLEGMVRALPPVERLELLGADRAEVGEDVSPPKYRA